MAVDVDALIDRRKLKRRLLFWRLAAILLLIVMVVALVGGDRGPQGPHIARIHVDGIIVGDSAREQMLKEIAEDDDIQAVVLSIDSPGGTAVGSELLYKRLRYIAERKPMVASVRSIAASGGYIAALSADRIIASENSITGSIGVIFQVPEFSGLLDDIGVTVNEVKSGALKGGPSPYKPMSEETRAELEDMVDDAFEWFKDLVRDRRNFTEEQVLAVSDGRVFSGRQAVANGLIDELGGDDEALVWLEDAHGIDGGLPLIDMEPPEDLPFMNRVLARITGDRLFVDRLSLDGLLTLWHAR
ncbi:MAG: signal peptide peptidase SppA [Alphaproteobacteria bacterium]